MRDRSFVVLSPQPWEGGWQSKQAVAESIARLGGKVLYVNPAWRPYPRQGPAGLEKVAERLWVLRPRSLPLRRFGLSRRANLRWIAWQVRRALRGLDMGTPVIWSFDPMAAPLVRALPRASSVYHLVDELPDKLGPAEEQSMALADAVLVTTEAMAERRRSLHPRVHLLEHGCDFKDIRAAVAMGETPSDLGAIPRPRAGYIGTLNARLDAVLLEGLLQRNPEVSFVLVGPASQEDVRDGGSMNPSLQEVLRTYPNVYALGFKPRELLPAYAAAMDVLLMPYDVSLWWVRSCSPLKHYLYLATGKPVVSMRFPYMERFSGLVDLADDLDGFHLALGRALAGEGPGAAEARVAVAAEQDWDRVVQRAWKLVQGS